MFGYRKPSTPTVTRSKVEEPRARTQSPRTSSTEDFFCSKAKYDDCEEHQVLLASTIAVVIYRFLLRPQLFDTVTRRIWTDYVCIVSSTTDAYGLKMFVSSAALLPCVLQTWPLVTCAQHEDLQHSCLDHRQTQQARADFTVIVKLMTHLDHGSPMLTGTSTSPLLTSHTCIRLTHGVRRKIDKLNKKTQGWRQRNVALFRWGADVDGSV